MKTPNPDNPIRNTLTHLALAFTAAAAFFTSGPAAKAEYFVVVPVAATAQSNYGPRPPVRAIDGSGMTPNSPVVPSSTCATGSGDNTMWLSNNTKSTWITFDLGSEKTLTGFHLWNYNEVNYSNRGVNTAGIYVGTTMPPANGSYASGGSAWGALAETFTYTQGPGAAGYLGEDYTFATPVTGRYIQIYVTGGFAGADAYTGISEIRFYEPASLTVELTSPQNGSDYLVGSTIPATATVVAGTPDYSVVFTLDSVAQGAVTGSTGPFVKNLTGLATGSHSLYATVTDSTSATDESPTRTFTVSNAGPTNLAAVSGNTLVNLSWNTVLGATGYKVFRSSPDNTTYSELPAVITGLTYQDTGLTNGTPYYYVVKATVGATVSDASNEVSSTPLAVDDSKATVVASAPYVWADGVATSTITVTLKDAGNAPAPDMTVTLASSRPSDDTVSAASGLSDGNGVVTFTVSSSVAGVSTYTATVTDIPLTLTKTATVGFLAPAMPPPVTAGLKLHLDASQIPGLSDGATVTTWPDMSGPFNNANLSAGTPIYKTGVLNTQPVVRFNNASSFQTANLTSQFSNTAATLFVVTTLDNDTQYTLVDASPNRNTWWRFGNGWAYPTEFRTNRIEQYSTMPSTGSHVFETTSSATAWERKMNGVSQGVAGGSYGAPGAIMIGSGYGSIGGSELKGDIAEILIYDRVLTSTEANKVGSYLTAKYGLTTTYPPINLTVSLTSPANGGDYLVGATIPATATEDSGNGSEPYSMEFFLDSGSGFVLQGTDTDSPYTVDLTGLPIGTYSLKAKVTDSAFATAESPTRTFTVSNAGPSSLAAVSGNMLVNLSWNQVLGATAYTVLRSSPDNSSYSEIATGITDLTYQNTGLTNGTPYFYVVKATVGATVSESSNEVSSTPLAVDDSKATVVASDPYVLADGVATSTITVTLKDGGNAPATDLTVSLASSRLSDDTVSATSVLSDENGVVTFTVSSLVPGVSTYTATVTDIPLTLTDTATVGFMAAAILPPVTNGLKLHLDASQIPSSDGASLLAWPDMSGQNNHATRTAGNPIYKTGMLNGKPVVRFNDASSFQTANLTSQFTNDEATLFVVTTLDDDGQYTLVDASPNRDTWWRFYDGWSYPTEFRTNRIVQYSNMPSTGSHVFETTSSATAWERKMNGASQGVAGGSYGAPGAIMIGSGYGSIGGSELNGDIAEVIIYDRVLTPVEADLVSSYLEIKYGLVSPPSGFGTWAATNAPGQTPGEDYDNDGVDNGIEYFMGQTGSSFTAMPGLDATNTVSWTMDPAYAGDYEVQTSTDLDTWTPVDPQPTPSGGNLSYTLDPGALGGKSFVRLVVTPTP